MMVKIIYACNSSNKTEFWKSNIIINNDDKDRKSNNNIN